jgi:hypothetical protein
MAKVPSAGRFEMKYPAIADRFATPPNWHED